MVSNTVPFKASHKVPKFLSFPQFLGSISF